MYFVIGNSFYPRGKATFAPSIGLNVAIIT